MDWLTVGFIIKALENRENEDDVFIRVMDAEHVPLNSNPVCRRWLYTAYSPITYILKNSGNVCVDPLRPYTHYNRRAAALIYSLYAHCGCSVDRQLRPEPDDDFPGGLSDMGLAVYVFNFDSFETLLCRCGAKFGSNENALNLLFRQREPHSFLRTRFRREFLQRLPSVLRYLPSFDPDVPVADAVCALHFAVGYTDYMMIRRPTDPDPETVRILIQELGADDFKKDAAGHTPLEALMAAAASVRRDTFKPDNQVEYDEWLGRVNATKAILQACVDTRRERGLAISMVTHERLGRNSSMQCIDPALVKDICKASVLPFNSRRPVLP
jgi:hypothetical protein